MSATREHKQASQVHSRITTLKYTHLDEHLLKLLASVVDQKLLEAVAPERLEPEDIDQRNRPRGLFVLGAAGTQTQ